MQSEVILIPGRGTKRTCQPYISLHPTCSGLFFFPCVFFFSSNLEVPCCVLSAFPQWQLLSRVCRALRWCLLPSVPRGAELELGRVRQVWCSAPSASPNLLAEHIHTSHAHPIEPFISYTTSFFFILCLFGTVLGSDCLDGLYKVGRGAFGLLLTWSALTFLQSPFSWAAQAWAFCSLDNALLWRCWRIRVWVNSGISPSNDKSRNELLCGKIHWSSLSALSNYSANT